MTVEGNVRGLRPFVNDWLLENYQRNFCPPATSISVGVPIVVASDSYLHSFDPEPEGHYTDGNIEYHLLERIGSLAIWECTYIECLMIYPTIDVLTCFVLGYARKDFYGADLAGELLGCDVEVCLLNLSDTVSFDRLYFMTFSIPPDGKYRRDQRPEYVMAICEGSGSEGLGEVWGLLCDQHQPEARLWEVQAQGHVALSELWADCENDPIREGR